MNRQWKGIGTYVVFLVLICLVLVFFEGRLQDRPGYTYQQFEKMLAEGCVFRHGKGTISRRDDGIFLLWRKTGAPCLKRGLFARIPRFFQVFILFGGINFRLFLRRDIALRSAVISRSCQRAEDPVERMGYRLAIFVAHGSVLQFPLGIGQPLRQISRSDADLKKACENLPNLAGAEPCFGQVGPVERNIFFCQRFQLEDDVP